MPTKISRLKLNHLEVPGIQERLGSGNVLLCCLPSIALCQLLHRNKDFGSVKQRCYNFSIKNIRCCVSIPTNLKVQKLQHTRNKLLLMSKFRTRRKCRQRNAVGACGMRRCVVHRAWTFQSVCNDPKRRVGTSGGGLEEAFGCRSI